MDISDIMTKFKLSKGEQSADENEKPWAPKHGPQRLRTFSNGQIRRMRVRAQKASRRKATSRYRRDFMRNELAVASLCGRLQVVGALPFSDPDLVVSQDHPMYGAAAHSLVEQYGSVADALETYDKIETERIMRSWSKGGLAGSNA